MDISEIQSSFESLDPDNIGSWPIVFRCVIWILVVALCGGAVYWFLLKPSIESFDVEKAKEVELIAEYKAKASDAANLEALKSQMNEIQNTFDALKKQLPKGTEVPGLLEDISQLGIDSGLEFEAIQLGRENVKEFYAELPIDIRVRGGYHAIATFVSGVSALPRIVTLHNYTLTPKEIGVDDLGMIITAKTYRYNTSTTDDEDEDLEGVE